MILAARDRGSLAEVLVIAAALSTVQDPRERPPERQAAADQATPVFAARARAEIRVFVVLEPVESLGRSPAPRNLQQATRPGARPTSCPLRLREWRDVFTQLTLCSRARLEERQAGQLRGHPQGPAGRACSATSAARSRTPRARRRAATSPAASVLAPSRLQPGQKAGKWIMVAELVDTSRLFGRCLARIEPEWLEEVGGHLLKRQVSEPHWSRRPAARCAWERGTLYGLTVYPRRRRELPRYRPGPVPRAVHPRRAWCRARSPRPARGMAFLAHNRRLVAEIERLSTNPAAPTCWWTRS